MTKRLLMVGFYVDIHVSVEKHLERIGGGGGSRQVDLVVGNLTF